MNLRRNLKQTRGRIQGKHIEKRIRLQDLKNYKECFVTGTAAEVTPVNQIGDYKFTPGLICKNLIENYTILTKNQV